jgi:hypothetical protein
MSADPGEQGGDTINPETGEFVDGDSGGSGGGGGFDDDTDTAEGAEDEFGSGGGDRFDDDFGLDGSDGSSDPAVGGGSTGDDDDDDSGVPDFDGRQTTIRGPEAPGNPNDQTQVIVEDRAGEDGKPARDPTDDAFVPNNRSGLEDEFGNLTGQTAARRRPRLSESVERLEGELARAGGGAVVTGEKEAFNIRRDDGQLRGEFTEEGLDEIYGTAGERTVAGVSIPERDGERRDATPAVERDTEADEFVPPTRVDPAVLDEPGSAEAGADLRADDRVPPQSAFRSRDSLRDPTLVRGEALARIQERRQALPEGAQPGDGPIESVFANAERRTAAREQGLRTTPNDLGDRPVFVPGTDGDVRVEALLNEASTGTSEFVGTGAEIGAVGVTATRELGNQREEELLEFAGGEGGFETTRGIAREFAEGDVEGLATETGDQDQATVEEALTGASAVPTLPAELVSTGKESVETALFTTGGTPAAGGSENEFDRRADVAEEAIGERAEQVIETGAANPARFGGAFVFGSAAEVGAVSALGRTGSGARLASTGRTSAPSAAAQTVDTFTPDIDAPSRPRSFVASERGQADLSGRSRSRSSESSDGGLPDRIAGTDPTRRRPADLGTGRDRPSPLERADGPPEGSLGSTRPRDATVRAESQLENLERMGLAGDPELRARAVELPGDDLRRLVDIEQELTASARQPVRSPELGPNVGGLLGSAEQVAQVGEPVGAVADQELDAGQAAATPRVDAGESVFDALIDDVDAIGSGAVGGVDTAAGARGRVDTGTGQDALARAESGLDLRTDLRADTRTDTRLDTGQRLDTRTDVRTDARTDARTETRVDTRVRFDPETRIDAPPSEQTEGDTDEDLVGDRVDLFADEFSNPVTTPEEFLGEAFGGER